MAKVIKFVLAMLLTSEFWCLFLSTFTIVLMMAWRSALRDVIFRKAGATIGKRY